MDGAIATDVTGTTAGLECRGLRKSYGPIEVLKSVDLVLRPGTVLGLIGENGAGKSTFNSIIAGVVAPSSGEMRLDGRPYTPHSPSDAIARGGGADPPGDPPPAGPVGRGEPVPRAVADAPRARGPCPNGAGGECGAGRARHAGRPAPRGQGSHGRRAAGHRDRQGDPAQAPLRDLRRADRCPGRDRGGADLRAGAQAPRWRHRHHLRLASPGRGPGPCGPGRVLPRRPPRAAVGPDACRQAGHDQRDGRGARLRSSTAPPGLGATAPRCASRAPPAEARSATSPSR